MKTLIVEDDFTSRLMMQELLHQYGPVHIAANGEEAVKAVGAALATRQPYDLICLDILMPGMDGYKALDQIRGIEESKGIVSSAGAKIFMVTGLDGIENLSDAFYRLCDAYLTKPIDGRKLLEHLTEFHLV